MTTDAERREDAAADLKPEILRTYAFLFERAFPNLVAGTLTPAFAPEVYVAVIKALRFHADSIERGAEY